jgi:hypothetical protein
MKRSYLRWRMRHNKSYTPNMTQKNFKDFLRATGHVTECLNLKNTASKRKMANITDAVNRTNVMAYNQ